jgi:uncharacterized protein
VRLVVEKRDALGRVVLRYDGARVLARTAHSVCIEAFFTRDIAGGVVPIHAGDRMIEWFFADRWYNIFQHHAAEDDHLKGWYCNITRPAAFTDSPDGLTIGADDLALDVFVHPDGHVQLLDEDELAALGLPEAELAQVWGAVAQLRALVQGRLAPFDTIRPMK